METIPSVLCFPALPGGSYPCLVARGLLQEVADAAAIAALPSSERAAVRVLITNATRGCDAALLALLPGLELLISLGAGLDRIDRPALAARGVALRAVGEALTEDVADLAMALTLMTARRLVAADAFARGGAWQGARFAPGRSLAGATMGIAGVGGRIGQAIRRRAEAARMHVVGLARPSAEGLGIALLPDMAALAAASDVLMLVLPGGAGLRHVVGTPVLRELGPDGILINVGRGELVDTTALIAALEQGMIAAAGLDVLEGEPAVPAALAALPNVTLTPHIGGATLGARARAAAIAEETVLDLLGLHAGRPASA
ncbi:2-hydroxyacid dehydrogenase [Roseomonas sp. NAR14]|uniref:2-hydroxyacid dehydrogenase n=1 Tax=Roseomonas acroporae TaxID=2937791 RepID=A0A9X2BUZ5_9PROT|nr:NAD(P)-dependent oxidoreductase [Roseomonas acroporae]MCK8786102.1 2-hydroxyacid dehydrogenase [Roseomonas acroporae]